MTSIPTVLIDELVQQIKLNNRTQFHNINQQNIRAKIPKSITQIVSKPYVTLK